MRQANDKVSRAAGGARSLRGARHAQQKSLKHQHVGGDKREHRPPSAGSTSRRYLMRAHHRTLDRAHRAFKHIALRANKLGNHI
jgi:hypothetical protein